MNKKKEAACFASFPFALLHGLTFTVCKILAAHQHTATGRDNMLLKALRCFYLVDRIIGASKFATISQNGH